MLIEIGVGMIFNSTQETMRVTRNPSDHSEYFGRGAHTLFFSINRKNPDLIKVILSLYISYEYVYFYGILSRILFPNQIIIPREDN